MQIKRGMAMAEKPEFFLKISIVRIFIYCIVNSR